MTHQEIDERSRALHALVAEKLRNDPRLLDKARANLKASRGTSPRSATYDAEWERIIARGLDAVLFALSDESEHAAALRACSPFAGVITPRERSAFLRQWRNTHAARRT